MGKGVNSIMLKADISHCRHLVQDALSLLSIQMAKEGESKGSVHNSAMCILEAVETRLKNMEKDYTIDV